jgi:hypothetical protein
MHIAAGKVEQRGSPCRMRARNARSHGGGKSVRQLSEKLT